MSPGVVTARTDTPLRELARILSTHAISGVPVVDDAGRVIGVVSESDIVDKERGPDVKSERWLSRLRGGLEMNAAAYASTAGEAMTSPPVVVEPWMSVYEAAWMMSVDDVNRLPVVTDGKLVGVIARADLVRYFARSDGEIARDVRDELALLQLTDIDVEVRDGHVVLGGEADCDEDLRCIRHAIARVPGVVSVRSLVTLRRFAEYESSPADTTTSAAHVAEGAPRGDL